MKLHRMELTMIPPRTKDLRKKSNIRHEKPSFELFIRVAKRSQKTLLAIAILLGYFTEM